MNATDVISYFNGTKETFQQPLLYIGIVIVILVVLLLIFILKIFKKPSNKMKGGKQDMAKPKKKVKETDVDFEENYIDDLENGQDDFSEEEPNDDDEASKKVLALENALESYHRAIEVNKKYIKKIWERVKVLEDNFKILSESR